MDPIIAAGPNRLDTFTRRPDYLSAVANRVGLVLGARPLNALFPRSLWKRKVLRRSEDPSVGRRYMEPWDDARADAARKRATVRPASGRGRHRYRSTKTPL